MTPPVNPSIPSSTRRGISLNKKTNAAPEAVTSQVKVVAKKAAKAPAKAPAKKVAKAPAKKAPTKKK